MSIEALLLRIGKRTAENRGGSGVVNDAKKAQRRKKPPSSIELHWDRIGDFKPWV